MVLLEIQNITKTYSSARGSCTALKNVYLTINKGEILSLLGVNGAGKSTLSGIIATLQPPTSGDILYNSRSIYLDTPGYRMHIGFCPQHPNLNNDLTVEQNLYFTGLAYRLTPAQAVARAAELLHAFKLTTYAQQKPLVLSGGYKQRVMLARTLMHKPALILLDEPTVGLDPQARYDLWQILRELRDAGVSILLTTHYIEEAEQLSDRVCVLDKGVIKLVGTPAELKTEFAKNTLESVFLELTKES